MNRQTVRVGVVGLGRISNTHIKGYQADGRARVVALCDIDRARLAAAAETHGLTDALLTDDYDALLARDDLDAVSLPLPDYLHHDFVLRAIAAGKHVLCEKPLAMTAAQAEEMLSAAEAAGVVHAVHMQRRYQPAARFVADLVAEGALGELRHFRCRMCVHRISDPAVKLEWRLQADRGCYGVLGDLGAHALDLAHFTMGAAAGQLTEAAALAAIFIHERDRVDGLGRDEVTGWDAINVAGRYETGVLANLEFSRFSPGCTGWEIDGQDASVRVIGDTADAIEMYERAPRDDQTPASRYTRREIPERYRDGRTLFGTFIEAILTGGEASPNFADGVRVARELDLIAAATET